MREDGGATVTVDHTLKALDMKLKRSTANAVDALVDVAARAANIGLDVMEKEVGRLVDVEPIEEAEEVAC
jgi:hypothetical protein